MDNKDIDHIRDYTLWAIIVSGVLVLLAGCMLPSNAFSEVLTKEQYEERVELALDVREAIEELREAFKGDDGVTVEVLYEEVRSVGGGDEE